MSSNMDADHGDSEEDPDFVHSEVDMAFEEDNVMYERNVTDGLEFGPEMNEARNKGVVMSVGEVDDDDLEYPSSEELLLACSSDEEVGYRFPEFLAERDMRNPQFEAGQLFRSMEEFRIAVRTYGALNGYNVRLKCNDRKRAQGVCKLGCNWRIWASKLSTTETVQVKSYTSEHTCTRSQNNRHCNYIFLTNRYIEQFKADPDWKTKSILTTVKDDLKTEISRNVANKMRQYAKKLLFRTMEETEKWTTPQREKKQKKRRKQVEEVVVQSQGKSYIKKKGQVQMTCSICKLKGHNKRYHSSDGVPDQEWYDAELEPVASNSMVAVNEHGKIVSLRGHGLSSTQNPNDEEPTRFIPTPVVPRQTNRD